MRKAIGSGLFIVCCAFQVFAGPEETAVLKHLWYDGSARVSTIRLECDGTPAFVFHRTEGCLRIVLPRTVVTSSLAGIDLKLQMGSVRGIVLRQAGSDSVIIVANLRDAGEYSIQAHNEGHGLVFCLARPVSGRNGMSSQETHGEKAKLAPLEQQRPLNIPGIVPDENTVGHHEASLPEGPAQRGTPLLSFFGLTALAIILAGAGTFAVIIVVTRGQRKTDQPERTPFGDSSETSEIHEDIASSGDSQEGEMLRVNTVQEKSLNIEDDEQGEEMVLEEETRLDFARGMRRGTGEIDLALRLGNQGQEIALGAKIRSLCPETATSGRRTRAAKKLGIGRGEIDLAIRLKEVEATTVQSGEES